MRSVFEDMACVYRTPGVLLRSNNRKEKLSVT